MYRSKDKEFMTHIKQSVLTVTKGCEKEERKYAIDYLRKHVKIDDLHRYALKKFPKKTIVFGEGSLSPKVVVVTKDPIPLEHRQKLDMVWSKMKINENDVYYAHLRFVKTKKKQEERFSILEKLLDMLNPRIILSFENIYSDKFEQAAQEEVLVFPYKTDVIVDKDSLDERKEITRKLKQVRPILIR